METKIEGKSVAKWLAFLIIGLAVFWFYRARFSEDESDNPAVHKVKGAIHSALAFKPTSAMTLPNDTYDLQVTAGKYTERLVLKDGQDFNWFDTQPQCLIEYVTDGSIVHVLKPGERRDDKLEFKTIKFRVIDPVVKTATITFTLK